MSIVQTEWWCLELPDEWQAEMDDDCVTITDCDGVGSIDVTVVKKPEGLVSPKDLLSFASELVDNGLSGQSVSLGVDAAEGLLFHYDEEGVAWREWYLAKGSLLIYITYNTDFDNKSLDDAIVDEILTTLIVLDGEDSNQ